MPYFQEKMHIMSISVKCYDAHTHPSKKNKILPKINQKIIIIKDKRKIN
jgi:hypothetical protein